MIRTFALAGAALVASAVAAHAQPAPDYVRMAGASDKFEITEAQMAQSRARNPRVRQFAAMMIRDHTKSTNMIKAAVRRSIGHNPPPPMMEPRQRDMVAQLRGARGPEFERTYLEQQIAAHQEALDLHQRYARDGSDPALRRTAEMIVPVVQHHLDMARDMQGRMR